MAKGKKKTKKEKKRRRIVSAIIIALVLLLGGGVFYISMNFNTIISDRIVSIYSQSKASQYYDLKFNKLRVNIIDMSVRIYNVEFRPRFDNNTEFFEKNGSIQFEIEKIVVKNADLIDFISANEITIKKFIIKNSRVKVIHQSAKFSPFEFVEKKTENDSLELDVIIESLSLAGAQLEYEGSNNSFKHTSFKDFSLELEHLKLADDLNKFSFSLGRVIASLEEAQLGADNMNWLELDKLQFGVSKFSAVSDNASINIDYSDFFVLLTNPLYVTPDDLYTISANEIRIDKGRNEVNLKAIKVKPNLPKEAFVRKFKYQTLRADLEIEDVSLNSFDLNKLVYKNVIYIDTLQVKGVVANLYKDKRIPMNVNLVPQYLAKQIYGLPIPININTVVAEQVDVYFSVSQEDGRLSSIDVNSMSGTLKNIQNQDPNQKLYLQAKGQLQESVPFWTSLVFNYSSDFFTYKGNVYKSNLVKLSEAVRTFAPAAISAGIINSIDFQGSANRTSSKGTMTFKYEKLKIDIQSNDEKKKKGFQNMMVSLAANTYLYSNNPVPDQPIRKVSYGVKRDMNKGFINILITSLLEGVKETLSPTKENRHNYKHDQKVVRKKKK